jgi:pyrroloquinoline quinone biosynthesis protein E
MPTRDQVLRAKDIAQDRMKRYKGQMQITFVLPDYFEELPKACYGGWGRYYIVVAPDGRALPCHGAYAIPSLELPNVREHSIGWIWRESSAFQAFRGDAWMKEPCRSCPRKAVDFGGCRCQALALTGDAANADPVCTLSPYRHLIDEALHEHAGADAYVYRDYAPEPQSA